MCIRDSAEAAPLKMIWDTPSLLNNPVMVRDDVAPAVSRKLQQILLTLPSTPAGRTILDGMSTTRFHPSDDASYEKVRDYVANFEKAVRPVEQK